MSSERELLNEREWQSLLREIHRGQVIPVVGPAMITVEDKATGKSVALSEYIAPRLAQDVGLESPQSFTSINEVARQFLLTGNKRRELYISVADILEKLDVPVPEALIELARISDFRLFICSSVDSLLAKAVASARPGFSPERGVIRYHYKGNPERPGTTPLSGNPSSPCDLPATFRGPLVYHILGDYQTQPDFAIWEEDYMEFICGLLENRDTLKNLFQNLSNRHLLLLGAPSEDWIVRFFLRAARGERLSDRGHGDYLADRSDSLGEPMVFFLNKVIKSTRIIDGNPGEFVRQMAIRWRAQYGAPDSPQAFLARQPDELPRGSVFISYSRRDLDVTVGVAQALASAGIPVWLDKQRLNAGDNYETRLAHAVKSDASFFLALISRNTEADPEKYVHKERKWAAEKHVDGYVYYVPLIIDDVAEVRLEPPCFSKIHRDRLSDTTLPRFVQRMCSLMEQFRDSGYPRG